MLLWLPRTPHAAPFREGKAAPRPLHVARSAPAVRCAAAPEQQQPSEAAAELNRRSVLGGALSLAAASAVQLPALPAKANRVLSSEWELVDLPVEKGVVLLDIGFTGSDPNHGGCTTVPPLGGSHLALLEDLIIGGL